MTSGPRNVTVNVVVDDVETGKYHFETSDLPLGHDNFLTFDNLGGHSGFHIRYTLQGAEGYAFPTDLSEALYVRAGSSTDCPTSKSNWGQFQATGTEDGGRTLRVDNKNNSVSRFAYTLRATNGTRWLNLDPGGLNQNGGGNPPSASFSSTTVIIGAVAILALVILLMAFG